MELRILKSDNSKTVITGTIDFKIFNTIIQQQRYYFRWIFNKV